MGKLDKVSGGQRLRPQAATWNAFVDAARAHEGESQQQRAPEPGEERPETVLVKNIHGTDAPTGAIMVVTGESNGGAITVTQADDAATYGDRSLKVCVAVEPIVASGFGRASVHGVRKLYTSGAGIVAGTRLGTQPESWAAVEDILGPLIAIAAPDADNICRAILAYAPRETAHKLTPCVSGGDIFAAQDLSAYEGHVVSAYALETGVWTETCYTVGSAVPRNEVDPESKYAWRVITGVYVDCVDCLGGTTAAGTTAAGTTAAGTTAPECASSFSEPFSGTADPLPVATWEQHIIAGGVEWRKDGGYAILDGDGASDRNVQANHTSDLCGADHYAELTGLSYPTSGNTGWRTRLWTNVRTADPANYENDGQAGSDFYNGGYYREAAGEKRKFIGKQVDGSNGSIVWQSTSAEPSSIRTQAEGSNITLDFDGAQVASTTDSAISSGVYVGMRARVKNSDTDLKANQFDASETA